MAGEEADLSVVFGGTGKDAGTELREPALARVESEMSSGGTADARGMTGTVGVGSGGTADARGATDTGDVSGGVALVATATTSTLQATGSTLAPRHSKGL